MSRLTRWRFLFAGDVQVAAYPGRIIITEPQGLVQPRIEEKDKVVQKHVVLNGQTVLPCIAQAHPVPTYRYARVFVGVYVCSCKTVGQYGVHVHMCVC